MTIRQTTIAKLQRLPESLLLEVSDFIDLLIHKHPTEIGIDKPQDDVAKAWEKWFDNVDILKITPTKPVNEYQQLLVNKYRKQGLEL